MPDPVVLSGVHAVKHAVRFGAELESLVSADPAAALAVMESVAPDIAAVISVRRVPADEVVRIAGAPVDLVGLARRPSAVPPGPGPAVLLDNPRHLGNLGAVIRVAAGFGARAVLSTGTVDPWHPTVVRAAAGLHYAVPVRHIAQLPDSQLPDSQLPDSQLPDSQLPDSQLPDTLLAFDADGEDLRTIPIPDDAVLAFGSERHGLSADVRARATRTIAIPIRDRISSYNLATSVAVALYAWAARAGAR